MKKETGKNIEEIKETIENFFDLITTFSGEDNNPYCSFWAEKGDVFKQAGLIDDALKFYEETEQWNKLADYYFKNEQYDKAFEYASKCTYFDYEEYVDNLITAEKNEIAFPFIEKALSCCEKWNVSDWMERKARCLFALNRYEEAIDGFDTALKNCAQENQSSMWFYKGVFLRYLKRYSEAISCFEKCMSSHHIDDYNFTNQSKTEKFLCELALKNNHL